MRGRKLLATLVVSGQGRRRPNKETIEYNKVDKCRVLKTVGLGEDSPRHRTHRRMEIGNNGNEK